jgi:hypothetical protein
VKQAGKLSARTARHLVERQLIHRACVSYACNRWANLSAACRGYRDFWRNVPDIHPFGLP